MGQSSTMQLVGILRHSLRDVERDAYATPDSPALVHLKQRLIQSIAELELHKESGSPIRPKERVIVLRVI
jgi:hypothetical protein